MHDVEDIYPLSPLQSGFLFHSLYAPEAGEHLLQISCTLTGPLDVARFHRACAHVVASHPALRTSFVWDDLDEPLQIVRRAATPVVAELDWRDLDGPSQARALEDFLVEDRRRGFALDQPPLMRWTLARTGADRHVLAWTCHHLLVDGWSLALVLGQCLSAYEAIVRGGSPAVVAARPYRDYIAWLKQQPVARAERYWRDRLDGFRAATPLPRARTVLRDAGATHGTQRRVLAAELDAALADFTRAHAITPSSFFQAIWALLLARNTGERDVVFGTVVAGRPAALDGVADMVGMFVNTIPVRVVVTPEISVVDWMRRLQGEAAEAREFEHASLSQIHSWSELPRGAAMFETLLVYENFPAIGGSAAGSIAVADAETRDVTSFALDIDIIPGPPYTVLATYARDRYDDATVARLLDQLAAVVAQILASPEARVGELASAPDEATPACWYVRRDYPVTRSITSLIDDTVRRTPDRIAAAHRDARLTYRELDAAANRIAHALIDHDAGQSAGHNVGQSAGHDSIVALLVDRDLSLVTSIVGILKSGAAYLPLDPAHPAERLAQILTQARVPLLVVSAAHEALARAARDRLAPTDRPRLVQLDTLRDAPERSAPPPPRGGDSLAYVIFTSGSTGAPKGAMLAHAGKINHMLGMLELLALGADDVVAQTASQCFDLSVWQLLAPLLVGGRVEIFDTALLADPARLLAHVERSGVTVVEAVPSVVANLLDELDRIGDARPPLAALRWMIPTAEAVPPELYRRWLRHYPGHRMANAYGPTEAHDVTNLFVVAAPPGDADERVPIGAGLPNVRLYLCDDRLARVPIGVAGELCVGGIAVGRGYLRDPAGTAAAFVPDPFSDVPGARLYRTGDRCRYRDDGAIEFLERSDFQIKIRGHRIEAGDIESAIARAAGVRRCVVAAVGPDRDRLVAYLVLDGAALADPRTVWPATSPAGELEARVLAIHADLQHRLPRALIPAAYVVLPRLPVTPNGKVDRRALPQPDAGAPPASATHDTPEERAIAQIWQAVLGRPVGVDDNFFELGGHSLIVIRVQSRLREAFGLDLPLRTLFELPTVRQLAARIEAIRWAAAPSAATAPAGADDDEDIEI